MENNKSIEEKINLLENQKIIKYKEHLELINKNNEMCYELLEAYQGRKQKMYYLEKYKHEKTNIFIKKLNRFLHPVLIFVLESIFAIMFLKQYFLIVLIIEILSNTMFMSYKILRYNKKYKKIELELSLKSLNELEKEIDGYNKSISEIDRKREYINDLSKKNIDYLREIENLINTYKQKINEESNSLETTNSKIDDNYQKVKKFKYKK